MSGSYLPNGYHAEVDGLQTCNQALFHAGHGSLSECPLRSEQEIPIIKRPSVEDATIKPNSTTINEAFDRLREVVPSFPFEKRISKIETLRLSLSYIGSLLLLFCILTRLFRIAGRYP